MTPNVSTTTPNQDRRLMQLKKAMMKRITDKMSIIKQIEEQNAKSKQVAETVNRIVNKDRYGHVVKYLARRVL